jgi:hypothetical protein
MATNTVSSICTGAAGTVDGPADGCKLSILHCLLVTEGQIYIGHYAAIRTITCKYDKAAQAVSLRKLYTIRDI